MVISACSLKSQEVGFHGLSALGLGLHKAITISCPKLLTINSTVANIHVTRDKPQPTGKTSVYRIAAQSLRIYLPSHHRASHNGTGEKEETQVFPPCLVTCHYTQQSTEGTMLSQTWKARRKAPGWPWHNSKQPVLDATLRFGNI